MEETATFAAGHHVMRLYESESSLARSVANFFARGLRRGDPAVMFSTPDRFDLVATHLSSGLGLESDLARKLLFIDAQAELAQIMDRDGNALIPAELHRMLDGALTSARASRTDATLWTYGDDVDLLCLRQNHEAAIRFEELANPIFFRHEPIAVLCGYAVANFDRHENAQQLHSVCRQHTHLIPAYGFAVNLRERPALEPVVSLAPRARPASCAWEEDSLQARTSAGGSPTIFLIDDEESVRRAVARLLAQLMLPVRTFGSAEEFLAKTDPTARGCLIVDVNLTGMKGTQLQSLLRNAHWSLPVIAISGSHDPQVESESLRLGAWAFLYKPFDAKTLIDATKAALSDIDSPHQQMYSRPISSL